MRENSFPFSDTEKRYHTFSYFSDHVFGGKLARIPLDAGFSCPNRAAGGCVFCAAGSAAPTARGSLDEQYNAALAAAVRKWRPVGTIPYLQANTNTFAPPAVLREIYARCAALPGAKMLAVATRADCLGADVLDVLAETAEKIPLLVELGMQTSCEATIRRIGRGYTHAEFLRGYAALRRIPGVRIGLHLMNGLPGEGEAEMLASAREAARLMPEVVKLHTTCVLRGTALAREWERGEYVPLEFADAVGIVCREIRILPPEVVIARISADAEREVLLAPGWVRNKRAFSNAVDGMLAREGWVQGDSVPL